MSRSTAPSRLLRRTPTRLQRALPSSRPKPTPRGRLEASLPETNQLPDVVVDCVVERSKQWAFPKTVAGKTFVHEMKFPVPGR